MAQEVVRRGHEIGNHPFSHPTRLLMSPARVREEVTASIMRQVRPGSIIGLQDTLGLETIQTLRNIIEALTAGGLSFRTVSELVRRAPEEHVPVRSPI